MASKSAVLPLLRRELRPSLSRISGATSALSTIARPAPGSAGLFAGSGRRDARYSALISGAHGQIRPFSQSPLRKLTDEHGNFDPRQVDRESDEVDVCIVGGGKHPAILANFPITLLTNLPSQAPLASLPRFA